MAVGTATLRKAGPRISSSTEAGCRCRRCRRTIPLPSLASATDSCRSTGRARMRRTWSGLKRCRQRCGLSRGDRGDRFRERIQVGPLITLNNGVQMPALGFGTLDRESPEQVADAVEAALAAGYRLIDTAASYAVERQVGEGIARSGIPRSELFVTTKLWISDY